VALPSKIAEGKTKRKQTSCNPRKTKQNKSKFSEIQNPHELCFYSWQKNNTYAKNIVREATRVRNLIKLNILQISITPADLTQ
jgi:hypothetical protein